MNNVEANYEGINVQLVVQRSNKSYYGHVEKQIMKLEGGVKQVKTLVVKWVNQEEPKYFGLLRNGKFRFKFFCKPVNVDVDVKSEDNS